MLTYIQLGKMECQPSEENVYCKVNRSGVQRHSSTEKRVRPFCDITKRLLSHNAVLQHPGLPLDGGTIIPARNLHVCLGHHVLFHKQFFPPEIPSWPDLKHFLFVLRAAAPRGRHSQLTALKILVHPHSSSSVSPTSRSPSEGLDHRCHIFDAD